MAAPQITEEAVRLLKPIKTGPAFGDDVYELLKDARAYEADECYEEADYRFALVHDLATIKNLPEPKTVIPIEER